MARLGSRRAQGDDECVEAFDALRVERESRLAGGERTVRRRDLLAADGGADLAPQRSNAVGSDVELRSEALCLCSPPYITFTASFGAATLRNGER